MKYQCYFRESSTDEKFYQLIYVGGDKFKLMRLFSRISSYHAALPEAACINGYSEVQAPFSFTLAVSPVYKALGCLYDACTWNTTHTHTCVNMCNCDTQDVNTPLWWVWNGCTGNVYNGCTSNLYNDCTTMVMSDLTARLMSSFNTEPFYFEICIFCDFRMSALILISINFYLLNISAV